MHAPYTWWWIPALVSVLFMACSPNEERLGAGTGTLLPGKCEDTPNGCSPNATCTNEGDEHRCSCSDGYSGDGVTCDPIPITSCATRHGGCAPEADCTDTRSGPTCRCRRGWSGDGLFCAKLTTCADLKCGPRQYCEESSTWHASCSCIGAVLPNYADGTCGRAACGSTTCDIAAGLACVTWQGDGPFEDETALACGCPAGTWFGSSGECVPFCNNYGCEWDGVSDTCRLKNTPHTIQCLRPCETSADCIQGQFCNTNVRGNQYCL